jgi:hypothetical protein
LFARDVSGGFLFAPAMSHVACRIWHRAFRVSHLASPGLDRVKEAGEKGGRGRGRTSWLFLFLCLYLSRGPGVTPDPALVPSCSVWNRLSHTTSSPRLGLSSSDPSPLCPIPPCHPPTTPLPLQAPCSRHCQRGVTSSKHLSSWLIRSRTSEGGLKTGTNPLTPPSTLSLH